MYMGRLVSPLLHWGSCLATGSVLFGFPLLDAVSHIGGHSPLILGHCSCPRSLSDPGDASYLPTLTNFRYLFILKAIWPSFLSLHTPDSEHPHSHSLLLFHPVLSLDLPPMSILLTLLNEIQASLFLPSFLFYFIGSVKCSMGILYFMGNIHV